MSYTCEWDSEAETQVIVNLRRTDRIQFAADHDVVELYVNNSDHANARTHTQSKWVDLDSWRRVLNSIFKHSILPNQMRSDYFFLNLFSALRSTVWRSCGNFIQVLQKSQFVSIHFRSYMAGRVFRALSAQCDSCFCSECAIFSFRSRNRFKTHLNGFHKIEISWNVTGLLCAHMPLCIVAYSKKCNSTALCRITAMKRNFRYISKRPKQQRV